MLFRSAIEEITRRVLDTLPGGLADMERDLRKNVKAAITQVLRDMDLVTREEYEVQRRVLARTREKLEQLEARAKALEIRLRGEDDTQPGRRGD